MDRAAKWAVAGKVIFWVVLVGLLWTVGAWVSSGGLTPHTPLSEHPSVQREWSLNTNPRDTYEEFCESGYTPCWEAWSSDQADYLSFGSKRDAQLIAGTMEGPTVVSYRVVIRFTDDTLTDLQRAEIALNFDAIHDS